ncbi:MAG TPA: sialidase family protein, partial [Candidatus Kapabacteria bacterium]|nr:sialidase family protein [Candidatus Kapabacteria bacterium]
MNFRCAYFWDTAHGVVAGDRHIFRYDSGIWRESSYPETPDTFRSLRLLDGENLYAASGSSSIWESTDSGASWNITPTKLRHADDIYIDPNGRIQGMNQAGSGMMAGTSFARLNDSICAAAHDDSNSMLYSTDGGVSWNVSQTQYILSGYCCIADTCAGILYTISDGLKYTVWKSLDGGKDWILVYDFVTSGTDILDGGTFGVLYAQGDLDIFRSVNGGQSWTSLGRPKLNGGDKRMFAFGPYDNYLISMNGCEVWLWSDLRNALPWPDPLSLRDTVVDGCFPPTRDTMNISQWPPTGDTLILWADKDGAATLSPDTIKLTPLHYKPPVFRVSIPAGQKKATFPLHLSTRFYCQTIQWDTSITILIAPKPMVFAVDSISLLTCSDTQIPIRITAPNCDTFIINSIECPYSSGIFVVNNSWKATVLPGARNTVWLEIHGNKSGSYATPIHITATSNGTGLPF